MTSQSASLLGKGSSIWQSTEQSNQGWKAEKYREFLQLQLEFFLHHSSCPCFCCERPRQTCNVRHISFRCNSTWRGRIQINNPIICLMTYVEKNSSGSLSRVRAFRSSLPSRSPIFSGISTRRKFESLTALLICGAKALEVANHVAAKRRNV